MSCITAINSGDTKVGVEKKNAAANVPVRFANNTNPHKRITFINLPGEKSLNSGMIVVMVFSVKSCSLPKITMIKPVV